MYSTGFSRLSSCETVGAALDVISTTCNTQRATNAFFSRPSGTYSRKKKKKNAERGHVKEGKRQVFAVTLRESYTIWGDRGESYLIFGVDGDNAGSENMATVAHDAANQCASTSDQQLRHMLTDGARHHLNQMGLDTT